MTEHGIDVPAYMRLGDLLEAWRYAGRSPKGGDRLEVYSRLDNVWYIAVLKMDEQANAFVLTTFHRLYARKLEGRIRDGYLQQRKEEKD